MLEYIRIFLQVLEKNSLDLISFLLIPNYGDGLVIKHGLKRRKGSNRPMKKKE